MNKMKRRRKKASSVKAATTITLGRKGKRRPRRVNGRMTRGLRDEVADLILLYNKTFLQPQSRNQSKSVVMIGRSYEYRYFCSLLRCCIVC